MHVPVPDTRQSWRVLLANVTLAGRTGTETATRGLALGLLAAGQVPMVYAPQDGPLADEIRANGIPVVTDLGALPNPPDVIHGHHHVETLEALFRFPGVPAVFVCHDRTAVSSAPPLLDRIGRYVAVDWNCLERLTLDYGIPASRTAVIANAVELDRFSPRPPLPPQPRRAAIFSNYAEAGTHLEPVQEACARLGLPLDVLGSGVGNQQAAPELVLGSYDVVFAKARCALEALAVGTAVVLCDTAGLGPMVTSQNVQDLRWWNFGRRTLRAPLRADAIAAEVTRYDARDAAAVSAWIRASAGVGSAVNAYLALYSAARSDAHGARGLVEDLRDYATRTSVHVASLEAALTEYRQPFRMHALTDDECLRLRVRIRNAPAEATVGAVVHAQVEVESELPVPLGTFPPYPVNLSYRWLDGSTGEPVIREGTRTPLATAAPGGVSVQTMRIPAPPRPGPYRLRVTLVQEGLRWLDYLDPLVGDEATVSVTTPPGSSPA